MLRVCITFVVLAFLSVVMMGSGFKETDAVVVMTPEPATRPACPGFTVIEASRGVDCHGDTVRLVKRGGFYELASNLRLHEVRVPS